MPALLSELLLPVVVLDLISRLKKGRGPLGSWWGFQPNAFDPSTVTVSGPNTLMGSGSVRNYTYRIFDHTRVPMKFTAPGTGPVTVSQNPMGQNTVAIARMHQKIPINYEMLGNLSPMIGPNSQIDTAGQAYVQQQTNFLGEQANNAVEMMTAGMMRDSLYIVQSGQNWLPTFTAPVLPTVGFQIPFQIPAGNKNQLNMLGTGNIIDVSWDNNSANIFTHLMRIKAAYAQLNRYTMSEVWINSIMWPNIISNTQIRNLAGSVNQPFASYDQIPESFDVGAAKYKAVLKADPTVNWHFCDDTMALNTDIDPSYSTAPSAATLAKLVPDNMAIFCSLPGPDIARMYLGGEYVVENPGMAATLRMGWYFWHEYVTQPSAMELIGLLNAMCALYIPNSIAPATVVFTGY